MDRVCADHEPIIITYILIIITHILTNLPNSETTIAAIIKV